MYDFETILVPLNEHPKDDLTYLSRHIIISVAIHNTLSKEPAYLVDENPERFIERFIEVLTEKQKAIETDVLKQHLFFYKQSIFDPPPENCLSFSKNSLQKIV